MELAEFAELQNLAEVSPKAGGVIEQKIVVAFRFVRFDWFEESL